MIVCRGGQDTRLTGMKTIERGLGCAARESEGRKESEYISEGGMGRGGREGGRERGRGGEGRGNERKIEYNVDGPFVRERFTVL